MIIVGLIDIESWAALWLIVALLQPAARNYFGNIDPSAPKNMNGREHVDDQVDDETHFFDIAFVHSALCHEKSHHVRYWAINRPNLEEANDFKPIHLVWLVADQCWKGGTNIEKHWPFSIILHELDNLFFPVTIPHERCDEVQENINCEEYVDNQLLRHFFFCIIQEWKSF